MYYYIMFENGEPIAYNVSNVPLTTSMTEVTKEEFEMLGGTHSEHIFSTETPSRQILPEIKALMDRQEFLEDCIAEMAQIVYS